MKRFLAALLVVTLVFSAPMTSTYAKSKVKLNKKKITITVGKTYKLKVKNKPAGKKVKWKTSNKKVATVSKKGTVKGKKAGKATITAKVGSKKIKCKVTVKAKKVVKPVVTTTKKVPVTVKPTQTAPAATTTKNDVTVAPTQAPTVAPTQAPTVAPTQAPTVAPTQAPTVAPTQAPTVAPTQAPTQAPTNAPATTKQPTGAQPTEVVGLIITEQNGAEVSFAWGQTEAQIASGQTYKVYIDGEFHKSYTTASADKYTFPSNGKHVIKVTANLGGVETTGMSIDVTVSGAGSADTTSTTQKQTTANNTEATTAQTSGGTSLVPAIDGWNTYPADVEKNGNSITANLPAYTGGNPWDSQMTQNGLVLTEGKSYRITVTLTSTVARKLQVVLQSDGYDGGNWSYITQDVFSVEANKAYTYTKTVTATSVTNNYLLGILMGYVDNTPSEAGKVTVTEAKFEEVSGGAITPTSKEEEKTTKKEEENTTKKEENTTPNVATANWVEIKGEGPSGTYYYNDNHTAKSIVNMQKPGFASEVGVYITVDSGISNVTVNGNNSGYAKDGAGVVVYLSALTQEYNTVVITHANGTATVVIKKGSSGVESSSNNQSAGGSTTIKNEEGSVYMPRTTAATTKAVDTNNKETKPVNFTQDSTLQQPFGVNLTASATPGYLTVVWGAGNPNCYNVYVDGERRRTGIAAQSLTMPVYTSGTHTVKITTVSGLKESIPWEGTITISGTGEKETEEPKVPSYYQPQYNSSDLQTGKFMVQVNNNSNGAWADNEVFWCIVGLNSSNQYVYVDKDGSYKKLTQSLNTLTINNRKMANLSHSVAEAHKVYLSDTLSSARMYVSYGQPVYLGVNDGGYAGPNLADSSDPNYSTLFEFEEFTLTKTSDTTFNYWGNTTRVDFFAFPTITRLIGGNTYYGYDKSVGDTTGRKETFDDFYATAPTEFKTLVNSLRIMAPCKTTFNEGQIYGNYFDAYINEFWTKYASQDLVIATEQGSYTGRVINNRLQMKASGSNTIYYIDKPTTQDVLEGKGTLHKESTENRGTAAGGVELAIQAQICAAFNRGVATTPENWFKPSAYYKNSTNNFYAGFTHKISVNGYAYGFCYDDVNDQSTLLENSDAKALVIDTRW